MALVVRGTGFDGFSSRRGWPDAYIHLAALLRTTSRCFGTLVGQGKVKQNDVTGHALCVEANGFPIKL
jgi:hypothetical protein